MEFWGKVLLGMVPGDEYEEPPEEDPAVLRARMGFFCLMLLGMFIGSFIL